MNKFSFLQLKRGIYLNLKIRHLVLSFGVNQE